MYFVKFENIGVFVKESGKLVSSPWNLKHEIFQLEEGENFKKMIRKSPFANCKRIDYFDPNKKEAIPRYIMDYILDLEEVKAIIILKERDNKINQILE
jgi:hypothetical protein